MLNFFCVIVLTRILLEKKYESHMYKYLLAKAICDCLFFAIALFNDTCFFIFGKTSLRYSLFMQITYLWLKKFLILVFLQCSGLFEIAATIDCFISINKKLQCCQMILCFYTVVILSVITGVVLNIYVLITLQIVPFQDEKLFGDLTYHYKTGNTPFRETELFTLFNFFQR